MILQNMHCSINLTKSYICHGVDFVVAKCEECQTVNNQVGGVELARVVVQEDL